MEGVGLFWVPGKCVYKYILSFKKFIFSVLQNNPNLLKQLIAQSGSSKSKLSSLPQGVPLMNGK